VDPHHFDAAPDPVLFDADADTDSDPTFHSDVNTSIQIKTQTLEKLLK
jgi:hypothetical protein